MENNKTDQTKAKRSNIALVFKLIVLIRPLIIYLIIAVLCGVLGFLAAILIPVLGAYGLFVIEGSISSITLKTVIITSISVGVLRGVFRYVEQLCNHYIAFKILAIFRDKIFKSLRRLAPAKLESKNKGALISLVTSDVELLEVFYAHTISPILIACIVSSVMIVFITTFHWAFGVIALCAYIFVGLIIPIIISRHGREDGIVQRKNIGEINNLVLSSLKGMRELMQYGKKDDCLKQIKGKTDELRENHKSLAKHQLLTSDINTISICTFPVILLIVGAYLYYNGQITISALIIPTITLLSSFGPVVALSNLSNNLLLTFASGNRVIDIIEEEPITKEVVDGVDIVFDNIVCHDVDFSYDNDVSILKDFNISIKNNTLIGLVGKSGTGKSTILKLIMRFWDVTKGSIKISNEDINKINTHSLRENEVLVSQAPVLFNDSIYENIRLGKLDATKKEIEDAAQKASVHDFIQSLPNSYETTVGELGDRLSTGEKQRICLARSFLHDAPLILLDEPTSNIDCLNEGIILKSIKESSKNKTVIMVSHRKSSVKIADSIIDLN